MDRVIKKYCNQVGRLLRCLPETRKAILHGLNEELQELPPVRTSSIQALEAHYGSILQTADELQDSVPLEEQARHLKTQRFKLAITGTLCAVLAILMLFCGLHFGPTLITLQRIADFANVSVTQYLDGQPVGIYYIIEEEP